MQRMFTVLIIALPLVKSGSALGFVSSPCQTETACKCSRHDGVIDLSPLGGTDRKPAFSQVSDGQGCLYSYSPCRDFSIGDTKACQNVALCQFNTTKASYAVLGEHSHVEFGIDPGGRLYLLYQHESQDGPIESYVFLTCTRGKQTSNLTVEAISPTLYHLYLNSTAACPTTPGVAQHPLSVGSILCIVFASIVAVYFGTGMLYRRVVHEESGAGLLPHRDFWSELPGLIRDGYLFFISPCLGNTVRYQAYRYDPL